jgi:hypothetical protein
MFTEISMALFLAIAGTIAVLRFKLLRFVGSEII